MTARQDLVKLTPGQLDYVDQEGNPQTLVFQANPTSLTRSRSITLTQTQAGDASSGTKTGRGETGRKFTQKADNWKIEGLEIVLEASLPDWEGKKSTKAVLATVEQAMEHLEALAEPDARETETDPRVGFPPLPGPPAVLLSLGRRTWQGYVTSVRIEEKQFTPELEPVRVRATLSFEVINTPRQLEQYKKGGKK